MLNGASASAKPRLLGGGRGRRLVARAEQAVDEGLRDALVKALPVTDGRRLFLDERLHLVRIRVTPRRIGALHASVVVQQRRRPVLLARAAALLVRIEVVAEDEDAVLHVRRITRQVRAKGLL